MKYSRSLLVAALAVASLSLSACSRVGNGEVGVRYHTMGSDRGVESEPLGMGWYATFFGTSVETFPTFTQTHNWTNDNKEEFSFTDQDGLPITADVGITLRVDPTKAPILYQRYRRGLDEILDSIVHNMVRDSFIDSSSNHPIEYIYGPGRSKLLGEVTVSLRKKLEGSGIIVDNLYWIGRLGLPDTVVASINSKTVATQNAQKVENEVATAKAEAQKKVAEANGDAQSILARAEAQAKANQELAASITPQLIEYEKVKKWNGVNPGTVLSGNGTSVILH